MATAHTTFRDRLLALAQTLPTELQLPQMCDALMRALGRWVALVPRHEEAHGVVLLVLDQRCGVAMPIYNGLSPS